MKKEALIPLLLFPLLIISSKAATAQEVKEVIIATNVSYADYAVASVAAAKIGAALFFTSPNQIPNETLEAIKTINPQKIYIVGGPAVVSIPVERELSRNYEVERIWGMTRYGTSCEVAKYFWPEGSEEAILVWDLPDSVIIELNVSSMILQAAEVAANSSLPLILIPKNHLTKEIEETLKVLNVTKVTVYGNVGSKVFEELDSLGIKYEHVSGEPREIAEKIEERIRERLKEKRPLIIAAVANWQEGLVARASPHGVSLLVFSENEINRTVEKVKEIIQTRNVSRILVVGKPELAQKIYEALIKEGINQTVPVIWVTGKHYEVGKKIYEQTREELKKIREKYQERLERIRGILIKLKENVKERCEYWYLKANETAQALNSSVAKARLSLIEELYKMCLDYADRNQTLIALRYLNEIMHETRMLIWEERNTFRIMIENEIEGEEEDVSLVRERLKARWQVFLSNISSYLPQKLTVCRSLIEDLKGAIDERNFTKERKLRIEIAERCAMAYTTRQGILYPLRR